MQGSVLTEVALPIALAVIMITLGLSLTLDDFKRVFVVPKGVGIGLVNLLLVSPLLAFLVATVFDLGPVLAVGLVLLGASPGGTTANLLTHLARGDVALSVSMTAISSIAALITVPLYLGLAIDHFDSNLGDEISLGSVVLRVFFITIVPLLIGMALRRRYPEKVSEVYDTARKVALGAFVLVVIAAVVSESETITDNFAEVAGACLALNVAAMAISFTVARLAKLSDRQSTAIAMELGVHNSTLAITVAATIDTSLTIPAAVYSVFMFVTAGLFAKLMHSRNTAGEASPAPA
ncbi:MAG: bile acid:sodium symporter family protein [Thermoleophilaceae bacterium]|nr:bile acid:sodium symporter family protein [Thermoleophilaceae bacterium]